MTKIKLIFLNSFLILLMGCNNNPIEVTLKDKTKSILKSFEKKCSLNLAEYKKLNEGVFYEVTLNTVKNDKIELQIYLVEYKLNDYINKFQAHSKYNGYDVVIYGDLNPIFYDLQNSKETSYVHKYGGTEEFMYDPPYWNLYFNNKGELISTSPKEVYETLNIPKAEK